ncbi:MAG TPA: translocation/assembly module TamB domain-containing protein [Rhodothermales bacterium]|nr:translocation/assembly module TamB domain-containing protein [Rhodothermales bacterium]
MLLLTHIASRVVRTAVGVALLIALVFLALTRTQVGRDELKQQVEQQFNRQFKGHIEIGRLKGNLVNTLYASDVRILDSAGATVLSADSVVVYPRWRDLLRHRVSVGTIKLFRPTVHLIRTEAGTWTLPHAFASGTASGDTLPSGWSIHSTHIHVLDGAVVTTNQGAPPEAVRAGRVFDFTDTRLERVNAQATLEWDPDSKLIELQEFSGALPGLGLGIDLLQGQFVLDEGALTVNEFELHAGTTMLGLSGEIGPLRGLNGDARGDVDVRLTLRPSHINMADVRRFLPSSPLADAVDVQGDVEGSLSALTFDGVRLERGQTILLAQGRLTGLPDSLAFDVTLKPSALSARDVAAVMPNVPLPQLEQLGAVHIETTSSGAISLKGADVLRRLNATFAIRGQAGTASGQLRIDSRSGEGGMYHAAVRVQGLDLARVLKRASLQSRLNGTLAVDGVGLPTDTLNARVHLNLQPSVLAGRAVDTLVVAAEVQNRRVTGGGYYTRGAGVLATNGTVDFSGSRPAYALTFRAKRLDLGPLLLSDSLDTDLTATATVNGLGLSLADLGGRLEVAFDSSAIRYGQTTRILPPHHSTLEIIHSSTEDPRIEFSGDVGTVRFDGDVALEPLVALARLWGAEMLETARREYDKPLVDAQPADSNRMLVSLQHPVGSTSPFTDEALRRTVRESLVRAGFEQGLATTLEVELRRPDILSALLPMLPSLRTDLRGKLQFIGDADTLALSGTVAAESIQIGDVRARGLDTRIQATASLNRPLDQSLVFTVDLSADSLHAPGYTAATPSLSLHYQQRAGELSFSTGRNARTGPVQLAAAVDLLPDRNRLTLFNLRLAVGGYEWRNTEDYPIDLYANAVAIPGLTLESRTSDAGRPQRIHVEGTLSRDPGRALTAEVENISLHKLSTALHLEHPLSGLLNGQLALTGGLARPALAGRIEVPVFVFDGRVLGQLNVTSRYIPGKPDVALDALVQPVDSLVPAIAMQPEELSGGNKLVSKENAVHVSGTVRLPQFEKASMTDPGSLDLDVELSRLDLFFFEDLFPDLLANVNGYATGKGGITGTFTKPVPSIEAEIRQATFQIPEFKLAYSLTGPVHIDQQGIHVDAVHVADATGGSADISGGILFNDYRYFSFDLKGGLDDLQIMNVMQSKDLPFYGRIWASGSVNLDGPVYSTTLRSPDAVTSPNSEVFIPLTETGVSVDPGFIVFADSTGKIPDLHKFTTRKNLLASRPAGERSLLDGMGIDLNIYAPEGSTVHLVIDPLLGDVINAVGSGRIQLQRTEGDFSTYGEFDAVSGDYLFTAGDVFYRRFLIDQGTITWDGDPINASLDIQASYRTRASTAGLTPNEGANGRADLIPLIVKLDITGRVAAPEIGLNLAIDRRDREAITGVSAIETKLNQPDMATEYATSVLLTNSFLLTTDQESVSNTARVGTNQFAFNSLSQLVTSQINRYVNHAIPNLDVNLGFQGERAQDLDITYGVALRLLDEKLVIRGQGVYLQNTADRYRGEVVVEVKLSPTVSVEVFYRKEGDILSEAASTNTTGAGLSYETQFSTWHRFTRKLFGWLRPDTAKADAEATETTDTSAAELE